MLRQTLISLATAAAAVVALSSAPVYAADVLGSGVDSTVFSAAIGSTTGWSFLGTSTSAFTGSGSGTLDLRELSFGDSFGYSTDAHTNLTQVFGTSSAVGSSSTVTGFSPSYLFYFAANNTGSVDDNTQFTDGTSNGGLFGASQGDIDIFKNTSTNTWAFFYDDGGPAGIGDDNDFNDLVVTFHQTPASVPEPGSLAILGMALISLFFLVRRKGSSLLS